MTIELSQEELTEALELAAKYGGTHSFKTKTTDGDETLLVVLPRKARTRQPKAAAPAATAAPQSVAVDEALARLQTNTAKQ